MTPHEQIRNEINYRRSQRGLAALGPGERPSLSEINRAFHMTDPATAALIHAERAKQAQEQKGAGPC